jgi:hypothetical protein
VTRLPRERKGKQWMERRKAPNFDFTFVIPTYLLLYSFICFSISLTFHRPFYLFTFIC